MKLEKFSSHFVVNIFSHTAAYNPKIMKCAKTFTKKSEKNCFIKESLICVEKKTSEQKKNAVFQQSWGNFQNHVHGSAIIHGFYPVFFYCADIHAYTHTHTYSLTPANLNREVIWLKCFHTLSHVTNKLSSHLQ